MSKRDTKEIFLAKAKSIHGDKYDYSKVEYVDSQTKVCIICPEHGEFWQTPASHLRGNECPMCANKKRGVYRKWDVDMFIKKAKEVHGDKYDYSKVVYVDNMTDVCIICPQHGEFWQSPASHIFGKRGCPKCKHRGLSREELLAEFRKVHGDKYDYSKFVVGKMNDKACFICPEHGEFWQSPTKHLRGQGCPKCGKERAKEKIKETNENFINRANKIWGDTYDLSNTTYVSSHEKIEVRCKKHGVFKIYPEDFLDGHGCQKCGKLVSAPETEIYEFVSSLIGKEKVIHNDRSVIGGKQEIDILIPSLNLGIEYNGLYWHSELAGKTKWFHYKKSEACEKAGIKLIQIFEDEYLYNREIVFSKLRHLLGADDGEKIGARKCVIEEGTYNEVFDFLAHNHIQGAAKSSIYLKALYNGEIVGVMSFTRDGDNKWILSRFATKIGKLCQGLGGKMFSYFIQKYNPSVIKSFADRRWSFVGKNLYEKLGFVLDGETGPDYHYVKISSPKKRIHKFNFRKGNLKGINKNKTESEITRDMGYMKIWDCGLYRYIWKKGR